ncbi:PLD nuclease N-terminal domain-containing protein [Actinomyces vulturis]|uniref:PLD nuclease N-terminal domain-containing protein n=1 Tax=Actinomyces vulturis TaxID=1857645 RepID=UPI00082C27D3|nr:PLD nuclease N-terminal domain-containing protein [Actinomyces vulturis]
MRVLFIVFPIILAIYAVADCARTPENLIPAPIPKALWLLFIVLFTPIGPIAWIIISRVKAAEEHNGRIERSLWSSDSPSAITIPTPGQRHRTAPDDDPEFLKELAERLRKEHEQQPKTNGDNTDGTDSATSEDDDSDNASF